MTENKEDEKKGKLARARRRERFRDILLDRFCFARAGVGLHGSEQEAEG